jgi:hypothetical protein
MTDVCVYDQYHSIRRVAKYTCRTNAIPMTKHIFGKRTPAGKWVPLPSKKSRESKTKIIHLVPRKIHNVSVKYTGRGEAELAVRLRPAS